MSATSKIAIAVASGYLLGRTRKLKLAIAAGSLLAGKRLGADPGTLLKQGVNLVENNPELKELRDQLRGRLLEAAKGAAITLAVSRLEHLNRSLLESGDHRHTDADASADDTAEEDDTTDEDDTATSRPTKKSASSPAKKTSNARKNSSRGPAKKPTSSRRSREGGER